MRLITRVTDLIMSVVAFAALRLAQRIMGKYT